MLHVAVEELGPYSLRVWRGGSGQPLLFLHGYEQHPGSASFLTRMAEFRDVYAPELPGYGESSGIDEVHDIFDVVLLLRALLDRWEIGQVDLVGHSLGGMIAAELAIIAPERVRKLVLVSSYGLWLDSRPLVDQFTLSPEELASAKWHNPDLAKTEPSTLADDDPLSKAVFRARNLGTATKFLWPIPDRGLVRRLPYLRAEALIVHGLSDGLVPFIYAEELARSVPGAALELIADAGHLPMVEAEAEFLAIVRKFLE